MEPDIINKLSGETAGHVASKLITLSERLPDRPEKLELVAAAHEFKRLVDERNALMHGKPATARDQGQRLFRDGAEWSVDKINEAADAFTAGSIPLNAALHGFLAEGAASVAR